MPPKPRKPVPEPNNEAAKYARTEQNRRAGKMIKAARGEQKGILFAPALSQALGVAVSESSLSNYETGRRAVPAAVLLAASDVSGKSLDVLFRSALDEAERASLWRRELEDAFSDPAFLAKARQKLADSAEN